MTIYGNLTEPNPISPKKLEGVLSGVKTSNAGAEPFAAALRDSLASTRTNLTETLREDASETEPETVPQPVAASSDSGTTSVYSDPYDGRYGDGLERFVSDGQIYQGYYGMDSDGHWGYYADAERTQKLSNGFWDTNKASDGGRALFESKGGHPWPSPVRDESRAGQTVTITAGRYAYEIEYDEIGYVISIENLTVTRGVDGRELDLPPARSLDDRGVSGSELKRQIQKGGHLARGTDGSRGATWKDWEPIMAVRGVEPDTQTAQADDIYGGGSGYGADAGYSMTAKSGAAASGAVGTRVDTENSISDASVGSLLEAVDAERAAAAGRAALAAKPALTEAQVAAAIKARSLTPDVLYAYEYYFGEPYKDEDD